MSDQGPADPMTAGELTDLACLAGTAAHCYRHTNPSWARTLATAACTLATAARIAGRAAPTSNFDTTPNASPTPWPRSKPPCHRSPNRPPVGPSSMRRQPRALLAQPTPRTLAGEIPALTSADRPATTNKTRHGPDFSVKKPLQLRLLLSDGENTNHRTH